MRQQGQRTRATPVLGFALLAIFIVGQVAIIAMRSVESSSSKPSVLAVSIDLAISVMAVFSVGLCALSVWRYLASRRDKRVGALSGGTIVLSAIAGPSLDGAISRLSTKSGPRHTPVPVSLSVSANSRHLTLWSGFSRPRPFLRLNWGRVTEVRVDWVRERGRRSRALLLGVRIGSDAIELPLIVVGGGLLGAFPVKQDRLEVLAEQLRRKIGNAKGMAP